MLIFWSRAEKYENLSIHFHLLRAATARSKPPTRKARIKAMKNHKVKISTANPAPSDRAVRIFIIECKTNPFAIFCGQASERICVT